MLNNALRFDDEFVRHKILDVIGDMALVGHPIIGHLVAHRGGHALHTAFAAQVLEERDAWTLVESAVEPRQRPMRDRSRLQVAWHRAGQLTARPGVASVEGGPRLPLLFRDLPHVGFELVVLVLHGIEEQALQQVGAPLARRPSGRSGG